MPPARLQFAPISQKLCKDEPLLLSFLTRPPSTGPCRSDSVPLSGQPLAAPASQPGHFQQEPDGAPGSPVTPWPGVLGEEGWWMASKRAGAWLLIPPSLLTPLMHYSAKDPEERPDS